MARRSNFPRGGAVSPRRQTTWIAPADQESVAVVGGTSVIIGSFSPSAFFMLKPTIVRTRGECSVRPSSFGADVAISGAFGVGVVSDEAFAAGAASIPRPFDDADWGGWLMWQSFTRRLEFISGIGVIPDANWTWQIDSKAMRKVSDNETVVLMCESQTGDLNIAMHLRILLKLS